MASASRRHTGQQDLAVDRSHLDAAETFELALECGQIVGHLNIDDARGLLRLVEQGQARHADLLADDVDRAVGQRHDVGDRGVANQGFGEGRRELDGFGLVQRDLDVQPLRGPRRSLGGCGRHIERVVRRRRRLSTSGRCLIRCRGRDCGRCLFHCGRLLFRRRRRLGSDPDRRKTRRHHRAETEKRWAHRHRPRRLNS